MNENEKKMDENHAFVEKEYANKIQAFRDSQGSQKLWNYFLDITKKEYFKDVVRGLRKEYEIPVNGFEVLDGNEYRPPRNTIFENNFSKEQELRGEIIDKICKKYRLHYFDFSDVILTYIWYNRLDPSFDSNSCGLFLVSDIPNEKEEPFDELFQKSDDMAYPIAIRISPYASKRDLVDFLNSKGGWNNNIKFLQDKYREPGVKIGKVKTRNRQIQERNDFIYENRGSKIKTIRELLAEKGIFMDDGAISKIISLERQKRKEV